MPKPNIGQGDGGKTQLFGSNKCFFKDDVQFEALGALDELNSFVGFTKTLGEYSDVNNLLQSIQNSLFSAQSIIGIGDGYKNTKHTLEFSVSNVKFLEVELKKFEKDLPELKNFILSGGTRQAAALQVCRTLTRRAERRVVTLSKKRSIDANIQAYLNRLSDLFFTLARYVNKRNNQSEVIWRASN